MSIVSLVVILISLLSIAWSDFKSRAVWCAWFGILLIGILIHKASYFSGVDMLTHLTLNVLILCSYWVGLKIYFYVKFKKNERITDKYLGLGDMVFIIICSVVFTPDFLVSFIIFGAVFGVFFYAIAKLVNPAKTTSIPLAGILSIMLAVLYISFECLAHATIYDWSPLQWIVTT